jgi:hypothetical protein
VKQYGGGGQLGCWLQSMPDPSAQAAASEGAMGLRHPQGGYTHICEAPHVAFPHAKPASVEAASVASLPSSEASGAGSASTSASSEEEAPESTFRSPVMGVSCVAPPQPTAHGTKANTSPRRNMARY